MNLSQVAEEMNAHEGNIWTVIISLRREDAERLGFNLFLFEAPIDMLSFISMHSHQNWQQHSYAAACSVSDKVLLECLKNNPQIKNVYLCFDNDDPGQKANQRISDKLKENYPEIKTQVLIPFKKDWNEDLLMRSEGGDALCQAQ